MNAMTERPTTCQCGAALEKHSAFVGEAIWACPTCKKIVYRDMGPHDCWDNAVHVTTDGPLGHGWKCSVCDAFLQAG